MAAEILGRTDWQLTRDDDGHRTYLVVYKIKTDSTNDGPAVVMETPGLGTIGATWALGNDVDIWAWCHPRMKVSRLPEQENDKGQYWRVEQTYSTKPISEEDPGDLGNPFTRPSKISGSFSRRTKEAIKDRDGVLIRSSSHEQITGSEVEFDDHVGGIRIEQNAITLDMPIFTAMVNTVNAFPLWGFLKRCVKMAEPTWERALYKTNIVYYKRIFQFETDPDTFDRELTDKGTKALNGHWVDGVWTLLNIDGEAPDPTKPSHFIKMTDKNDNPTQVFLDGAGLPIEGDFDEIQYQTVEYYPESNFLLLNIPLSL